MTGPGTNTYIIGTEDVVVIDPGPVDEGHLERISDAVGDHLRYVVVTHSHRDHAPGALPLSRMTGATLLGFDERQGFSPDGRISEGDVLVTDSWRLEAMHTPGHASDHLCFIGDATSAEPEPRVLFSGDHIMGGSTVVIGPPDGDMSAYLNSLERVRTLVPPIEVIVPGHGQMMDDPELIIASYVDRRLTREAAIYEAVSRRPYRASELVPVIYSSLADALVRPATRSIWAHLRKLYADHRVTTEDPDDPESIWRPVTD